MVPLPLQLKEEARRGDVAALLSVHAFCKERNVGDHSTFIAIIDIILHNFRPELHPPGLSYLTTFPKAYRKWLKSVAICTSTLVFSIDSMLAAFPAIASTLQPLRPPSCRKLARYWEGRIWPCVSALIYWYISDDFQPPVSAHIQQETLNTEVSKLLQYLSQTRIGLLPRMQESPEVPPAAARFMIQALDWYPHPSSAYMKALSTLIHGRSDSIKDSISVIKELENNPQYLPGLVAFIPAHTTQLVERISEVHWVFTLAGMAFQSSLQLVRRAGTQFPTLIPKLMKALHYFNYAPSLPVCLTLPQPRVLITSVAGVIGEITKSGGYLAQRQALRRGILRTIVRIKPILQGVKMKDLVQAYAFNLDSIIPSFCQYPTLIIVLREIKAIEEASLDQSLLSSNTISSMALLKEGWLNFRDLAFARVPPLNEYNEFVLRGAPSCSRLQCPKDTQNGHRKCSVCKLTYYCSRRCQKAHWLAHKTVCQGPINEYIRMDDRDADFLEYLLSYDMEHHWHTNDHVGFDKSQIKYLLCNYRVFPPRIRIQPAELETVARMIYATQQPDTRSVLVFLCTPDTEDRAVHPYTYVPESLVIAALTGGKISRRKGERLARLHDDASNALSDAQLKTLELIQSISRNP